MVITYIAVLIVSYGYKGCHITTLLSHKRTTNFNHTIITKSNTGLGNKSHNYLDWDFFNNLLCLWRQGPAISFLSFKVAISGLKIMKYFSLLHRWHTPVTWLKGLARLTIFQLTSYSMVLSSNCQICLDKAVAFLGFLVLKFEIWFRHLSLKLVAVNPMYVSTTPSPLLSVAWYTTPSVRHFPSTGHTYFLQLHSFFFSASPFSFLELFRIF